MRLSKFKKKHIFCIEGNWTHDLKDKASIRTALDFLEHNAEIKPIRKDCSTIDQFKDLVETSLQKRYKQHSIYLAFHGPVASILEKEKSWIFPPSPNYWMAGQQIKSFTLEVAAP